MGIESLNNRKELCHGSQVNFNGSRMFKSSNAIMPRGESKINNFIEMVFLEPCEFHRIISELNVTVYLAVKKFKKKMIVLQMGIKTLIEDAFSRYFKVIDLSMDRVNSVVMRHCFSAYDKFPVFLALMYSCSFLVTTAEHFSSSKLSDFKAKVPDLCKMMFASMTGSSCSVKDYENLLQFSLDPNFPEIIRAVKSCATGANKLFRISKLDRDYGIFGVCDVSVLEKFQLENFTWYFFSVLPDEIYRDPSSAEEITNALVDLRFHLQQKIAELQQTAPGQYAQ